MGLRKRVWGSRESDVIDTYAGIPVTSYDLKDSTTTEERRGYRVITIGALAGAVIATIFWLFSFPSDLGADTWWSVALVFIGLFLAFLPIAYGPVARRAKPRAQVVGHLNTDRLDSFWYERGVTDETPETVYKGTERADDAGRTPPHP